MDKNVPQEASLFMTPSKARSLLVNKRQLSEKLTFLANASSQEVQSAVDWLLGPNEHGDWPYVLEPYQQFCRDKGTLLHLLTFYQEEASEGMRLLEHLDGGWRTGVSVAPWFDPSSYEAVCARRRFPDEAAILHFAREGYAAGLSPDPFGTCSLSTLRADLILHAQSVFDEKSALEVFKRYYDPSVDEATWMLLDASPGSVVARAFAVDFPSEVSRGKLRLVCADQCESKSSLARLAQSEACSERQILVPFGELSGSAVSRPSAPAALSVRRKFLRDGDVSPKITIRCPAPDAERAYRWGDFHFAESLSEAFGRLGVAAKIVLADEWADNDDFDPDATILLRGVRRRRPERGPVNLMWMLSHPDRVEVEELHRYDHVFVSSYLHAQRLASDLGSKVSPLLQCSDSMRFDPILAGRVPQSTPRHKLLFVGNSRKSERWVVANAIRYGHQLSIYGSEWEGTIAEDHVVAENLPNRELGHYYRNADIVLNDHWPDMAERGFVSNRIFDIGMSGGFVISDSFLGAGMFFGAVPLARDPEELNRMICYYRDHPLEREARALALHKLVRERHTFDSRAATILSRLRELF